MTKINVLRSGCFFDGKEVPVGEQEVSYKIATHMCTNRWATAIVEAEKVKAKEINGK